jgi:hypothetical protein
MHRVPAALLRARTNRQSSSDSTRWAAVVVRLLCSALPDEVWNSPQAWPQWQRFLPHVLAAVEHGRPLDDVPQEVCWLLDHAARYRLTRGEPYAALPLLQRAHAAGRARLGDDHIDTLAAAGNLANALHMLGRHQQAGDLHADILTRRRRVLGDDHVDTLRSAGNLAVDLSALGRYQQSRDLNEDTVARCRRVLGDDHHYTLAAACNLAADLSALGQHEQSRDLHGDILTRHRRVLGDDHPDTVAAAGNLAAYRYARGRQEPVSTLGASSTPPT